MRSRRAAVWVRALGATVALALFGACSGSSDPGAADPTQPSTAGSTAGRCVAAEASSPDLGMLGGEIATDPDLERRVLDNGLTIYARENDSPGNRGEISLVVKAGSALEPADRRGTADFLEHMLFNGTENFPGNTLIQELDRFGSAIGPDVNAYTTYDETVYLLQLPDVRRGTRELAVDVVREWADRATIDAVEVEAERGVVLEEWRGGTEDAGGRVQLQLEELLLGGTPYEGASTIGTAESIESIEADHLVDFYRRWYTPENMAVVATGDFDPDRMADLIEGEFEDVASDGEADRPSLEVEPWEEPRYLSLVEPELPMSGGSLGWVVPAPDLSTGSGWREQVLIELAMQVISNRLADGSARGDNQLSGVAASMTFPVRSLVGPTIDFEVSSGDLRGSAQVVLEEMERTCRFGFQEGEVRRVLDERRTQTEQAWESYDTKQDAQFASEYREHFLSGAAVPEGELRHELELEILDSITGDDLTAWFGSLYSSMPPSIFMAGKSDEDVPAEEELVEMTAALADAGLDAGSDVDVDGLTLMDPPEPVTPERSEPIAEFDGTLVPAVRLDYRNGVSGVVQHSPITEGAVTVFVRGEGGLMLVDDDQVVAARSSSQVITSSGAGALAQDQLDALLADKSVGVSLSVEPTFELFTGTAASADVEELLQLVHTYIATPKATDAAVSRYVSDNEELVASLGQDADMAMLVEAFAAYYGEDNPRFQLFASPEESATLTADEVEEATAELFRGGDWSFAVVGDLDLDELEDLASTYLGTLPASVPVEPWAEVPGPVEEPIRSDISVGTGDQASVLAVFAAEVGVDETTALPTSILTALIETRLREVIREDLGATYSVYVQVGPDDYGDDEVSATVHIGADPQRIDEVVGVLHRELEELAAGAFDEDELDRALRTTQSDFELIDNITLGETQLQYLRHPEWSYIPFVNRAQEVGRVGREDLVKLASSLFGTGKYVQVVQTPDN